MWSGERRPWWLWWWWLLLWGGASEERFVGVRSARGTPRRSRESFLRSCNGQKLAKADQTPIYPACVGCAATDQRTVQGGGYLTTEAWWSRLSRSFYLSSPLSRPLRPSLPPPESLRACPRPPLDPLARPTSRRHHVGCRCKLPRRGWELRIIVEYPADLWWWGADRTESRSLRLVSRSV